VASHLLTFEDFARILDTGLLSRVNGARLDTPCEARKAAEVVTLHRTGKTFTD
jgi:hypothetical protein